MKKQQQQQSPWIENENLMPCSPWMYTNADKKISTKKNGLLLIKQMSIMLAMALP